MLEEDSKEKNQVELMVVALMSITYCSFGDCILLFLLLMYITYEIDICEALTQS
jgi:hypothetical protein